MADKTMKERIDRQGDENLYQPKIHSNRIRELYALKVITGLPMTVLVDQAIQYFLEKGKEIQESIDNQYDTGKGTTKGAGPAEL